MRSQRSRPGRVRDLWDRVKRLFKREPPADPYALVGAPKKPRPRGRGAAAAEPLD